MTISHVLNTAAAKLAPKRIKCTEEKDVGRLEAEILLAHVLKRDRVWLLAYPSYQLLTIDYKLFTELVARRMRREPIAYIIGHKEFYGLDFLTDRRALIPRPETELLVELALDNLRREPSQNDLVWDVGTGCGAAGLAIAKHITPRKVLVTDVSDKTLALAMKNAKQLRARNVTFLKANLLSASVRRLLSRCRQSCKPSAASCKLVIVANLPYLPSSDKKRLARDVAGYEPAGALFAGQRGTEINDKFLRQLAAHDIRFSSLFLELDPPQAKYLSRLARVLFPHAKIKIHKDLAKRDRVLEISR